MSGRQHGPELRENHLRFHLEPPDDQVTAVVLQCERAVPGSREFVRDGAGWALELPRTEALHRVEYKLVVARGEAIETILDPTNPHRVRSVFGDKSVVELPGYHQPEWLTGATLIGRFEHVVLQGERQIEVPVAIWTPGDFPDDVALPLLLVHDGPEYDTLASITRYSAAMIAAGLLPPHRVALAHPVLRDAWYSGSPQYLRTIAHDGLGTIRERYAVAGPVAVMGASLGGLTALLVGLLAAPEIGGVFSQSGSFFQPRHDSQESGYRWFGRISRLVQSILDTRHTDHPLRVALTCGILEENAANNRDMAAALRRAGHQVSHHEVPDLHNYTAWRDSLHPALTTLLRDLWT